jgi:hypothetical protein
MKQTIAQANKLQNEHMAEEMCHFSTLYGMWTLYRSA